MDNLFTEADPVKVIRADCLTRLNRIPEAAFDAVVTDPPYPCIDRSYGYWTEAEWFALMDPVVEQCRRVLKPTGSAVFILQPNSEKVGRMRPWLWEFMAKWTREWGMVQDAWWWNIAAVPTKHCDRNVGLLRPSLKACVWLGANECYRDQKSVLWAQSQANASVDRADRVIRRSPSGQSVRKGRASGVADERGGVTPFNVVPIANTNSTNSAGSHGHGAGTPLTLTRWWVRYICPKGGLVLDPFGGSGTTGVACVKEGRRCLLIERNTEYAEIARARVAKAVRVRNQKPDLGVA